MAGQLLAAQDHDVVLNARDEARADAARSSLPHASAVLVADVSSTAGHAIASRLGHPAGALDAVIHNVAIGYRQKRRIETADGLSQLWAVNVLAPYLLTALMHRPDRLVCLSSELHRRVDGRLDDLQWRERGWHGTRAYSETKFQDVLLALAMARRWPEVRSNAVEPGWVPTRMGGPRASGDLAAGAVTQAWLAADEDAAASGTGGYSYHQQRARIHLTDPDLQDRLIDHCAKLSGVELA